MRSPEGNAPAFPITEPGLDGQAWVGAYGLTKREWFAGMALAGLLASTKTYSTDFTRVARGAYKAADAMIEAANAPRFADTAPG